MAAVMVGATVDATVVAAVAAAAGAGAGVAQTVNASGINTSVVQPKPSQTRSPRRPTTMPRQRAGSCSRTILRPHHHGAKLDRPG